jgi:hypothetical protein
MHHARIRTATDPAPTPQKSGTTRCQAASLARSRLRPLLAGLGLVLSASAAFADERGVYIGAQIFGARHSSGADSDMTAGITLGIGLNRHFAVEAGYKKTHLDPVVPLPGSGSGIQGVELALRGNHALNDWLGLTAKAGAYQWSSTDDIAAGPDRGTDAVIGAGLLFRVSDRITLSTEYEKILNFNGIGDDDHLALGVRIGFD